MNRLDPATIEHLQATHGAEPWPAGRGRIGVIVLSVDRATEEELRRMLPPEVAELHFNRIAMAPNCTLEALQALESDLARSAADLLPGTELDTIAFACTSGAVAIGRERVRACVGESHPGVPVTAPLEAAGAALRTLGAQRVAVVTPYIDEVNGIITGALLDDGIAISRFGSFHLDSDRDMTALAPATLRDAVLGLDSAEADALFICCTALRTSSILDDLEARTGKPVISSHQAMLWHALALAGIDTPLPGFGRLLARAHRSRDMHP